MISNSVSNKNWIFKKYDEQDVLFYKENYSLDEITSKLLSIRKIKKEDIQSFLNPSINSNKFASKNSLFSCSNFLAKLNA